MSVQPKSIVLLSATFVVAFALGLFVDARLIRGRRDRRPPATYGLTPSVTRISDALQPHSEAQRDSITAAMQKVVTENAATYAAASKQTRAHLDSLRYILAPILDSTQRVRLDSALSAAGRGGITRGYFRFGSPPIAPRPR